MTDIYRCGDCSGDTRECGHEPDVKAYYDSLRQDKIDFLMSEIDRLTRELNHLTKSLIERGHL